MRSHCTVIRSFVLLGLLTFQTVTSDRTVVGKSVTSSPRPSRLENKSVASVTMVDMNNALRAVANDSNQIDQLIPKMFNLSLTNPAYVFRLPQGGGIKLGFVTMQKSDFVQPIFPNLTASYVRLMKSKGTLDKNHRGTDEKYLKLAKGTDDRWNIVNPNAVEDDDPTLSFNLQTERNFIEYLSELNRQGDKLPDKEEDDADEWSLLGLHGWKGVLSKPKKKGKRPHVDNNAMPSNEHTAQKWNLPGKTQEKSLERSLLQAMRNTSILKVIGNFTQATYPITNMHSAHSDADVYIGRVNDPFGHSTKWNIKNFSMDATQLEDPKKRAVIELYSMIKCSTGCDPIVYKGYGCYCGFLGDGVPVDGIDRCCKLHDKCYESSNCISYLEYFVPYIWKCYRGKPLCAIDHGEWGGPTSCAARLCKCDLTLSRCLRRFVCPQRRAICKSSKARMLQNLLFNF